MPSRSRNQRRSIHWLFRSNIPSRRASLLPVNIQKRNFFGMGEILGVITNPAETVRSLTESKRLLDEARREINENREKQQIRPKHTFSPLPGFHPRPVQVSTLQRILEEDPSFIVLFGAPSVGKTALLREVLCAENYHVLHFDLRIAGFADISSLYISLSEQIEQYFEEIATKMKGYEEFKKEAWSFKHDRLNVERRLLETPDGSTARPVSTSDIVRLMELFQSSLLKYSEFQPQTDEGSSDLASEKTHVEPKSKSRISFRWKRREKEREEPIKKDAEHQKASPKKMPVIFFDEAHRLPALLKSRETMKCLLDSMLVLTKQDRLISCIHATSDPWYHMWLSQFNVLQHCKIITIGDCSKLETKTFFQERIMPRVPSRIQAGLDFERLYATFGGKLAHWQDYVTDYVHANGNLDVRRSTHFLQAYTLLNLHIIHSSQSSSDTTEQETVITNPEAVHSVLGPAGRKIYPQRPGSFKGDEAAITDDYYVREFTAMQLLKVMSRLVRLPFLPYFQLCRELGVRAVDGMVKAKLLDLRWTEPVSEDHLTDMRPFSIISEGQMEPNSGTLVDAHGIEDDDMVPLSEREESLGHFDMATEVIGPKLVPITPVMRYAMQEVIREYEEEQSTSEYASLSDVDEY